MRSRKQLRQSNLALRRKTCPLGQVFFFRELIFFKFVNQATYKHMEYLIHIVNPTALSDGSYLHASASYASHWPSGSAGIVALPGGGAGVDADAGGGEDLLRQLQKASN